MDKPINKIKAQGEISTCPQCGYKDGFHVSFQVQADEEKSEVILICPDCHQHFSIGLWVNLIKRIDNIGVLELES